jgi:hypothetical protein
MLSSYIRIVYYMIKASPALQTAAWLSTAWTLKIEDESLVRAWNLEEAQVQGRGRNAPHCCRPSILGRLVYCPGATMAKE